MKGFSEGIADEQSSERDSEKRQMGELRRHRDHARERVTGSQGSGMSGPAVTGV